MIAQPYDAELILPLELIRLEAAIVGDDRYTDGMLAAHRDTALKAAAEYTGLPVHQRVVTVEVARPDDVPMTARARQVSEAALWEHPWTYTPGGGSFHVKATQHVTRQIIATATANVIRDEKPFPVSVKPGTRIVPLTGDALGERVNILKVARGDQGPDNDGLHDSVQYVAGYPSEADIPELVWEGALDFVRHVIRTGETEGAVAASGAIDKWTIARQT